jgi:hypothetical protein
MSNIFSYFDLFGQIPSLKINGRNRVPTYFGSLVGFFTICFLITGMVFIITDFLNRLSYKVNSFVDRSARPNIDLKKLVMAFQITNNLAEDFPDKDRLFSFRAQYANHYAPSETENTLSKVDFEKVNFIKCNDSKEAQQYLEFAKTYNSKTNNLLCLDLVNLNKNLTGIFPNPPG